MKEEKDENTYHTQQHAEFVEAVVCGHVETVQAMLQQGCLIDVNYRQCSTEYGNVHKAALHLACERGNVAMVQVLLQAGADVNQTTTTGSDNDNDDNDRNEDLQWTPLHAACYIRPTIELVTTLLNAGADANLTNGRGETPLLSLIYAPAQFFPPPTSAGNERRVQIARLLLEEGQCHVNHPTKMGKTALSVACELHRHELVPLLVEYGAMIPRHAIFDCLSHPKLDTMAFLLEHGSGANNIMNAVDNKGCTALHYAAANGRVDVVRLLLQHQTNVSIIDGIRNSTPLMAAILQGLYYYQNATTTTTTNHHHHYHKGHSYATADEEDQRWIVHMLLERMARTDPGLIDHEDCEGYTALHLAAQVGSPLIIQEILDWKPNLTLRNGPERNTALHSALLSPYHHHSSSLPGGLLQLAEKLKCLLEHPNGYSNADDDSSTALQNEYGYTVLHSIVACSQLHPLIEYVSTVVDVRIPDHVNGDTALHMAAKLGLSNQDHYWDFLLRSGGHRVMEAANVRNHQGRTALMEAILVRNTDAVMALTAVTDLDIADAVEGKTALHYAIQKQDSQYVDMLLCRDANAWMIRDHQGNTAFALACCLGHNNNDDDNAELPLPLSIIFQLYRYGVAYGEQSNMI